MQILYWRRNTWRPYYIGKVYAFVVIYEDILSVGIAIMWISDVFLKCYPDQAVEQTVDMLVKCDITFLLRHCQSISRSSNMVTDVKQTILDVLWITISTQNTSVWNISRFNSSWLSNAIWHHGFGSNTGSINGLMLDSTNLLPNILWTYHQRWFLALNL